MPDPLSFRRRSPRLPLHCEALVHDGESSTMAEVLDLGLHGAGTQTTASLVAGRNVSVLLDPAQLPPRLRDAGLPSLPARVAAIRRSGHDREGRLMYRVGVEFRELSAGVEATLRSLLSVAGLSPRPDLATGSGGAEALGQSSAGRELLYQSSLEFLAAGKHREALDAIEVAARGEPRNAHYGSLRLRVLAEKAIREGETDVAKRHAAAALALAPGDAVLHGLRDRIARLEASAVRPPGLLRRLFGR